MKIIGKNGVKELLASDKSVKKIMMDASKKDARRDIIEGARAKKIMIDYVPRVALDREAEFHQGVVAIVDDYKYATLQDVLEKKGSRHFVLILDGVEDPQNLGAIIRVAECMGVDGIVIGKHRACGVTDAVVRASAGAISLVKIARVNNINDAIKELKEHGLWVYAVELGGEDITSADLSGDIAVVLGSEGKGVSVLTKKLCDKVVTMKMYGHVNSLNVSNACAIALNEVRRHED